MHVCIFVCVCIHLLCPQKANIVEHTISLDFDLCPPFPTVMNQSSSEKWLLPGLGQGRSKMSLEHFVMPKRKEMLKKKKKEGEREIMSHECCLELISLV